MKTVYVVLDGVAVGPMEIENDAPLLEGIRTKYPDTEHASEREKDPNGYDMGATVIVASTKK